LLWILKSTRPNNEFGLGVAMAEDGEGGRSATRGLATIALLKVNFDAGRDHLSMFEPFVLDTISAVEVDGLTAADVRGIIQDRHQLALPVSAVTTLLGRASRQGYLRRDGGRYFATEEKPKTEDLKARRTRVERRQSLLAEALRKAASERGSSISTNEDALALILRFLDQHHVALAIGEGDEIRLATIVDETERGQPADVTAAAFLQEVVLTGGEMADIVQEMLEGFVLQNTLLLRDISTAARRFKYLRVFFDSALLFCVLGLRGPIDRVAIQELLELLRDSGATLEVYEPTILEMRRILAVYEERLGTQDGRLSLHPTALTRYLLTSHYSPSDIRVQNELLERNLRGLGFSIRPLPSHEAGLTFDEDELGVLLADSPGGESVPRVVHDIDCVAAVLTIRKGRTSESLDHAGAIFVTMSGMTVHNTTRWYERQGGLGFPPIVHYLVLSNLAWLKRPASASRLKLHELVALCAAALRPKRGAWGSFLKHLKGLQETSELSSDDATAVVASGLTDRILVEQGIDEDSDAATLSEVVERVRESYRAGADAELREARLAADKSQAEALQLQAALESRSRRVASVLSWIVATLLATSLIVGTVLTLVQAVGPSSISIIALVLFVIPLAVFGLMGLLSGFHVAALRRELELLLARRIRHWLATPAR
jgi:hypothetical protein